jgi:hypothetical protein
MPKLGSRTPRQWLASSNSDIGHYLDDLPSEARKKVLVWYGSEATLNSVWIQKIMPYMTG